MVDGWRIALSDKPSAQPEKLFFVNLGAYDDSFTELHASGFFVAATAADAKKRAQETLLRGARTVHKDDLHQVDDCITLDRIGRLCITLTHTGETSAAKPNNGYHVVPKDVIAAYLARR